MRLFNFQLACVVVLISANCCLAQINQQASEESTCVAYGASGLAVLENKIWIVPDCGANQLFSIPVNELDGAVTRLPIESDSRREKFSKNGIVQTHARNLEGIAVFDSQFWCVGDHLNPVVVGQKDLLVKLNIEKISKTANVGIEGLDLKETKCGMLLAVLFEGSQKNGETKVPCIYLQEFDSGGNLVGAVRTIQIEPARVGLDAEGSIRGAAIRFVPTGENSRESKIVVLLHDRNSHVNKWLLPIEISANQAISYEAAREFSSLSLSDEETVSDRDGHEDPTNHLSTRNWEGMEWLGNDILFINDNSEGSTIYSDPPAKGETVILRCKNPWILSESQTQQ
jgi:hypothetical protein